MTNFAGETTRGVSAVHTRNFANRVLRLVWNAGNVFLLRHARRCGDNQWIGNSVWKQESTAEVGTDESLVPNRTITLTHHSVACDSVGHV
jgi:hypothetical protein